MRAMQISRLGDPWQELAEVDSQIDALPPGAARVEVAATDLNFADILQCQGRYQVKLDPPFTPGMGTGGTVVEVNQAPGIAVGDRIVGPTLGPWGGYAEEAVVLTEQATVVPDGVDMTAAVAAHVTYGTAWFGLHHRGQLKPGETVLVLAAAGGVGSAAVELAKIHECWVIAAAGGEAKLAAAVELGADEVVDYDADDLYERVMALTDGRGVDVVYDPVGGRYFDIARRLVAWEGRILIIGFASGDIPSAPANHALVKNYSIVGVHMGGYRQRDPRPFAECYGTLHDMLRNDQIHPLTDSSVGFADLTDGLLRLQNRLSKGRVMFVPDR